MSNGKLLSGLPIAVDYWKLPRSNDRYKTYLYFLTHLHTDHTKGLSSTWTETIYTSPLNRKLAMTMLKVKPEFIKPLEIGVSHILTLPRDHSDTSSKTVTVTLIDANHIRGSVMFLFEGDFEPILYTGDFRWSTHMKADPFLRELAESKRLNLLYVDNTFEKVGYDFPTREECMLQLRQILKKYSYHRIIFGCQNIGKEDVLLEAAHQRQEKVYVPETILQLYQVMGIPSEHFTTIQSESSLWFEKLYNISQFDLKQKNCEMPTIAIRLSAWGIENGSSFKLTGDELIMTVPYSNHCSSTELKQFLEFLQPRLVERIVQKQNTQDLSVIDLYSPLFTAAMTDDSSCSMDMTEPSNFDGAPFKSQRLHDYFQSAVNQNQSPEVMHLAMEETTALSEDMDSPVAHSPSVPLEKALSTGKPIDAEGAVAKASQVVELINSDLDHCDEGYIYTEAFMARLISLIEIYQPLTGIGPPPLD